jgi:hypothetical protein
VFDFAGVGLLVFFLLGPALDMAKAELNANDNLQTEADKKALRDTIEALQKPERRSRD